MHFKHVCSSIFQAFSHLDLVGAKLEEVGMSLLLRDNYMALMSAVGLLLEGKEAGGYLGVQLSTDSGVKLAQQLYAYLVAWTGESVKGRECHGDSM